MLLWQDQAVGKLLPLEKARGKVDEEMRCLKGIIDSRDMSLSKLQSPGEEED